MATGGNISQRIALEGAQEILKSLADIGVRGQAAFKQLQDAVQSTQPQLSSFEAAVNKVGDSLKKFSSFTFSDVGKNFSDNFKIGKTFDDLATSAETVIKRFGEVGLGVAAAAAGVTLFVKSAANAATETKDTADSLGLTIEAFQGLQFAAAASGVQNDNFVQSLKNLSKSVIESADTQGTALQTFLGKFGIVSTSALAQFGLIGKAADDNRARLTELGVRVVGVGENFDALRQRLVDTGVRFVDLAKNIGTGGTAAQAAGKAIQQLGVSVIDPVTRQIKPLEDILGDLAEKFKALGTGPQATALALAIFGRAGQTLLPLLLKGKSGVDDLTASFRALGIGLTAADAKVGQDVNVSFAKLEFVLAGVKAALGLVFAPALTGLINSFTASILANRDTLANWAQSIAAKVNPAIAGFVKAITGIDIASSLKLSPDQIVQAGQWQASFEKIGSAIAKFASDVKAFFSDALPAIFEKIKPLLAALSGGFEKLTGVKLSPEEMGLVLLGTQLLGINGFLLDLIKTFGLLLVAAVAAFGSAGLLGLAGAAFAAFVAWDFAPIVAKAVKAWDDIKAKWQTSPVEAGQAAVGAGVGVGGDVATKLTQGLGPQGAVVGLFVQAAQAIKNNFGSIVDFVSTLPDKIASALSGLAEIIVAPFKTASDNIIQALEPVAQKVRDILSALTDISQQSSNFGGFGGNPEGAPFARGGLVFGPGSATSDSVFARLSRGEFVINAAAVRHFGSDVFAKLNSFQVPRFNMGGFVDDLSASFASLIPVPGFATGGLASGNAGLSGRPLLIPTGDGGPPVRGVVTQSGAKRLEKLAVQRRIRSAGRKPGWF